MIWPQHQTSSSSCRRSRPSRAYWISLTAMAVFVILSTPASAAAKRIPVPRGVGDPGTVIPQLLDGNQYRTIIYIINAGTAAEAYRLNLMNEDGTPALYHFSELGGASGSLSGTLQPLGTAAFHTNGGVAAAYQVGWGSFDFLATGSHVKAYEVIESADPLTGNWTTQSMVGGSQLSVYDSGPVEVLFDQTGGFVCGLAIVNTNTYGDAALIIEILGADGAIVETAPLTVPANNHVQFVLSDHFPQSVGIVGMVRLRNAVAGDFLQLAVMGIKATAYKTGWTQTSLPVID